MQHFHSIIFRDLIIDSVDMSLSKLRDIVKDREAWCAPVHEVVENWTQLSETTSTIRIKGFSGGSVVKNPPANAGDMGLILESGKSPGEANGNPLQHSCLGNPMDRGAWRATVCGVTKSRTQLGD